MILAAQIAALVIGSRGRGNRGVLARPAEGRAMEEGAALPRRRGNDDTLLSNLIPKTRVVTAHRATADILHPHVDTHLRRDSLASFVRILVQFLTSLNNSARRENRPDLPACLTCQKKGARDKEQEARLQLVLLLHTIGGQIHFVTMRAAL